MEASSAGGEIWERGSKELEKQFLKRPLFVHPNLGRQTGRTDGRTSQKSCSTANSYRFAHALISRWRLISEASLPVFRRNRGGEECSLCEFFPVNNRSICVYTFRREQMLTTSPVPLCFSRLA
jgi:hypothetical protein